MASHSLSDVSCKPRPSLDLWPGPSAYMKLVFALCWATVSLYGALQATSPAQNPLGFPSVQIKTTPQRAQQPAGLPSAPFMSHVDPVTLASLPVTDTLDTSPSCGCPLCLDGSAPPSSSFCTNVPFSDTSDYFKLPPHRHAQGTSYSVFP
jgi:hypothetical protein